MNQKSPLLLSWLFSGFVLTSWFACRPRESVDACAKVSTLQLPDLAKETVSEGASIAIGGYLETEYAEVLLEAAKSLGNRPPDGESLPYATDAYVALQIKNKNATKGVYEHHRCTAMLDFTPIAGDGNTEVDSFDLVVWTAKHCAAFPFIKSFQIAISTADGYLQISPRSHEFQSSAPLIQVLPKDDELFHRLFYYERGKMNRVVQAPRDDAHPTLSQLDESSVYGRPLCNSFRTDRLQLKPFTFDKACFNFIDLVPLHMTVNLQDIRPSLGRDALKVRIQQHLQAKKRLYTELGPTLGTWQLWHKISKLLWVRGYLDNLGHSVSYLQRTCAVANAPELCQDPSLLEAFVFETKTYEKIANSLQDSVKPLLGEMLADFHGTAWQLSENFWQRFLKWLQMTKDLQISWNSSQQPITQYLSMPLPEFLKKTTYPAIIHPGGIALIAKSGELPWQPGDSGAMISYKGFIPFLSLSTVDDEESSGGFAASPLPAYQKPTIAGGSQDSLLNEEPPDSRSQDQPSLPPPQDSAATPIPLEAPGPNATIYDDEQIEEGLGEQAMHPTQDCG
jgi:hypothetical protein